MALQLNRPEEYIRIDDKEIPYFKGYSGKNVEQMPKLRKDGRHSILTAGLMERRLALKEDGTEVADAWNNNYFDTGDAFYRHPDGSGKVRLDDANVLEITPQTKLSDGAALLNENPERVEEIYVEIKGARVLELTQEEIEDFHDRLLTNSQITDSRVWNFLARNPKYFPQLKEAGIAHREDLLPEYVELVADKTGCDKNMALRFGSAQTVPVMRAWCVDWLDSRSDADSRADLDDDSGCFAGLAPEAQRALVQGSQIITYTMSDIQIAKEEIDALNEFVRQDKTTKTRELLSRINLSR